MFPQKDQFPRTDVSIRADVPTKGPMFPGTDVSKDRFPRTNVSTLLIYQLFSFDFVFAYDCLLVLGLDLAVTDFCGNVSPGKHRPLETLALGNIG